MDDKHQSVVLHINARKVNIDVQEYPIFCGICSSYFDKLRVHSGSRYGQGACLQCDCGAEINLRDGDNIVDWLGIYASKESEVASVKFNFTELFSLQKKHFNLIKGALGYDIYKIRPNSEISLSELIWEIEAFADLEVVPEKASIPAPACVEDWLGLLQMCRLKKS